MLTAEDARQIMRSVSYPVMGEYSSEYLIFLAESYVFEAARRNESETFINFHPEEKVAKIMLTEVKEALIKAGYVVEIVSDSQMKVSFIQTIEMPLKRMEISKI